MTRQLLLFFIVSVQFFVSRWSRFIDEEYMGFHIFSGDFGFEVI